MQRGRSPNDKIASPAIEGGESRGNLPASASNSQSTASIRLCARQRIQVVLATQIMAELAGIQIVVVPVPAQ
jgi:hypothetical protein